MKHVMLDTNVYIDWLNIGAHERWFKGGELVRHLSAVVLMELQAGATTQRAHRAVALIARGHERVGRTVHPSRDAWARAGVVLRRLQATGRETRRASLVNDVLIALNAREIGATLITRDPSDHLAIRQFVDFAFIQA